jgi:alkanesulfonate monooxygenase SsuD/methylene tetrahydromethanopterin reductase-like flavin-dependent oxidoreductase (luciferase family)
MEPLTLFSFISAISPKMGFATSILITPQRQTMLLAKQARTLDVLCGGGIGIGWNDVEYEALNENFHKRGERSEDQIELLRPLWLTRSVNFEGNWHNVTDAGINPMPVQWPIPIWLGGGEDRMVRRIARMAEAGCRSFAPTPTTAPRSRTCASTQSSSVVTHPRLT